MNITDIIKDVRIVINEAVVEGDSFSAETDKAIENFIRAALTHLASMPSYQGPTEDLKSTDSIKVSNRPDGMYYATIQLPGNCIRPVSLEMKGWARPVFSFPVAMGSTFLSQYASVQGLGAGPNSPVAFLDLNGKNIIAHAFTGSSVTEYTLSYIPVPQVDADGTLDVPERYKDALIYTASALYLQSVNEYDAAKSAFDTAGSYIQLIDNKQSDK